MPLHAASKNGHVDLVRFLLDRGANIDILNQVSDDLIMNKSNLLSNLFCVLICTARVNFN